MATTGYEVLVDELTVHKEVAELRDKDNNLVGRQNGLGETWLFGEILPADAVSPDYREALEDSDHPLHEAISAKLRPVSDEPEQDGARRLGLPFDGYDEMDEDAVLAAMKNLPSAAIQRIKEWESSKDDARERIANYNIGFGESPDDRQEGRVGSDVQESDTENKPTAKLKTRSVPEEGKVTPGEGVTGTGDPAIPYGSSEEDKDDDNEEKPKSGSSASKSKRATAARKGRRERSS